MFNEAAVVGDVVASARSAFARVICVDDGSSDGSGDLAQAAGAIVIRHPGNLGAGAALQTGLAFGLGSTRAEYFVTIDADGQHRIEDAIRMLERARESNADVILGSRFLSHESNIPTVRRIVLRAGVAFTRATTGLSITDTHNGLRVLSRSAAQIIRIRLHGMAHGSELLEQIARAGLAYEEAPVTIRYTDYSRGKGQSSLNALNILFELLLQKVRAS
jgi:glycosyltransferase involved in cell wall biosynthesis